MTLFVDVDGTLYQTDSRQNDALIGAIQRFVARDLTGVRVIVWSGGGPDYAERRGERALGWLDFAVAPKNRDIPTENDIVIDDMDFEPINESVKVYSPDGFIEFVEES